IGGVFPRLCGRERFLAFAEAREELAYPFQSAALLLRRIALRLFIGKVRCDAVERLAMHRLGAQLDFQCAAGARVNGRMDALIPVRLREIRASSRARFSPNASRSRSCAR